MIFPIEKKLLEQKLVNEGDDLANPFIRIDAIRQINDKRKDTVQTSLHLVCPAYESRNLWTSCKQIDVIFRFFRPYRTHMGVHGWMPGPQKKA
jgi:methionine synthase II (cobalamin-independent)